MSISRILDYVWGALALSIPVSGIALVLRGLYLQKTRKPFSFKQELTLWVFAFYLICLYSITVFREDMSLVDMMTRRHELQKVNLKPLVEMLKLLEYGYIWSFMYNFIGNIVWFLPFGFLVPMLAQERIRGYKVILMGAAVSLSIEVLQFVFVTGISDVDDVIFNTMGTALGIGMWILVSYLYRKGYRKNTQEDFNEK